MSGRGLRASWDDTVSSNGLGGGVIAEEAKGTTVLLGRGYSGPSGRRSCRGGGSSFEFVSTRLGLRPEDAVALETGTPRRKRGRWQVAAVHAGLGYKAALQRVTGDAPAVDRPQLNRTFTYAALRYALVQPLVRVVANGKSYTNLATMARENGTFHNQMEGGTNAGATWLIQLQSTAQRVVGQTTQCPRPTPSKASLDEAEVLPGTRTRVLTGQNRQKRRNEARRRGADRRCPARLLWMRLSWLRRG